MERTLTPHQLAFYTTMIWTWSVAFLPRLITTIVILIAGYLLARWAARNLRKILSRTGHVDPTIQPVVVTVCRYGILTFVFVVALSQVGFQTASLFAVLGAAGLAIGLALQGTLTNIAAGIMLLWLRPFGLGDYIEVPINNISGTVREIGLFVCLLESFDGITVCAPNSAIWNSALKNHSRSPGRLICLVMTLPVAADLNRATATLKSMLNADGRVMQSPLPLVFVEGRSGTNGIILTCSFHVTWDKLGDVQRTIISDVESLLEKVGAESIVPLQIIRTVPPDADPSRLLVRQDRLPLLQREG